MNKKFLVILSCLVLVWLVVSLEAEETPASLKKAAAAIDPILPYQLARTMASPEFGGRLTGDEGYTKAASWADDVVCGTPKNGESWDCVFRW